LTSVRWSRANGSQKTAPRRGVTSEKSESEAFWAFPPVAEFDNTANCGIFDFCLKRLFIFCFCCRQPLRASLATSGRWSENRHKRTLAPVDKWRFGRFLLKTHGEAA
jgi:hypothetical protein